MADDPVAERQPPRTTFILDQRMLAFFVGAVALALPVAMLLGAWLRTCFYDSISHFYYTQFLGNVFVGALVFIGTFLIVYRGEKAPENLFASIAGVAAVGVAMLPTSGRGCEEPAFSGRILADMEVTARDAPVTILPARLGEAFELFPNVATYHYISAAILFGFMAYYALVVFPRIIDRIHRKPDGSLIEAKQLRNRLYSVSGWVIVACLAALAVKGYRAWRGLHWDWWDEYNFTFWFEALALWAFGLSWMVKGRFWNWGKLMDPDERAARGSV